MNCPIRISYTIRRGDTFYKIAQRYRTTVEILQMENPHMNPGQLSIGDVITICPGVTSVPKGSEPSPMPSPMPMPRPASSAMTAPRTMNEPRPAAVPMAPMPQPMPMTAPRTMSEPKPAAVPVAPMPQPMPMPAPRTMNEPRPAAVPVVPMPQPMPMPMPRTMSEPRPAAVPVAPMPQPMPMPAPRTAGDSRPVPVSVEAVHAPAFTVTDGGAVAATAEGGTEDLRDIMRSMWEQQTLWMHELVVGTAEGLPEAASVKNNITHINNDIAALFAPFYDPDTAFKLAELLNRNLTYSVRLEQAMMTGDNAAATVEWNMLKQNTEQLIGFLCGLGASFNCNELRELFNLYIEKLRVIIEQYLEKRYADSISETENAARIALEIGESLAQGLYSTQSNQ